MSRYAPRPISHALSTLGSTLAPATTLAHVQEVWRVAAGATIAAAAQPVGEHDGVLTLACESSVWANELDLMGGELVERVNAHLGRDAIRAVRCRTA